MLDAQGFEIYEENTFPIAYLITFRTFGTWLHGDDPGSIQRSRDKRFRTIARDPNVPLKEAMLSSLKQCPVILNEHQRTIVEAAIVEVCSYRSYVPYAINVRSTHVHSVVSKAVKPEKIVNDFKAYATRKLRAEREFLTTGKIWSRGASTRYLWKPNHLRGAIDYVMYSQGDVPFGTIREIDD